MFWVVDVYGEKKHYFLCVLSGLVTMNSLENDEDITVLSVISDYIMTFRYVLFLILSSKTTTQLETKFHNNHVSVLLRTCSWFSFTAVLKLDKISNNYLHLDNYSWQMLFWKKPRINVRLFKKIKYQKYRTARKILNWNSLSKWQNQKLKHIKRFNKNCIVPDLVQAFSM